MMGPKGGGKSELSHLLEILADPKMTKDYLAQLERSEKAAETRIKEADRRDAELKKEAENVSERETRIVLLEKDLNARLDKLKTDEKTLKDHAQSVKAERDEFLAYKQKETQRLYNWEHTLEAKQERLTKQSQDLDKREAQVQRTEQEAERKRKLLDQL